MIEIFFNSLHWALASSLIVLVSGSLTVLCILLVRKLFKLHYLERHHDITSTIFSNFSVLYSVLIAFTIINAQNSYDSADNAILMEAIHLDLLYRDAQLFSNSDKEKIHIALTSYVKSIREDEWGLSFPSEKTSLAFKNLWQCYYALDASSKKQELWYTLSINRLNELVDSRAERIHAASALIGAQMWTFLISGGIIFLFFLCCFESKQLGIYLIMSFFTAGAISISLFLIYSLNNIFTGSAQISSEPFDIILHLWNIPLEKN